MENNLTDITGGADTICAVATARGAGGIAVIRVCGPQALDITGRLWHGKPLAGVASHSAHLGNIDGPGGEMLDQGVATVFRAPNTFTGEDTVELSVHGSTYIQQQLLAALINAGCRMARPGEFTRRAFVNGRLDLTEAEAVADIIAASSRAAHNLAVSQLRGDLSHGIDTLRESLIHIASMLELELDFSEEDVSFADRDRLAALATDICTKVDRMASTFSTGDAIRRGVPVAIIGRPNVGKSCLLNALLGNDRAIVSDIPGTTRDTIEDTIDINGITFRFIDTAGLRHTDDPIETIGIRRALDKAHTARIILWLVTPDNVGTDDFTENLREITAAMTGDTRLIAILNKIDLTADPDTALAKLTAALPDNVTALPLSARSGQGIDTLTATLSATITGADDNGESLIVANARHYHALRDASDALRRVLDGLSSGQYTDLIAQDLREAIHHLSTITGSITTDTLLDSIFKNFCVGK